MIQKIYMCDEEGNEWVDKKTYNSLYEEYEKANNIIKEVREKIRNVNIIYLGVRGGKTFTQKLLIDILEILDKVDKEKE